MASKAKALSDAQVKPALAYLRAYARFPEKSPVLFLHRFYVTRPLLFCLSLLLCLTFLTVEAAYGQQQEPPSRKRFREWAWQDAEDWVNTIDQKRVLRTAGFVAALVPLSFLDEKVSEAARDWNRGLFGDFLDCANEAGSFQATLIPTGIFLVSLATDNAKFQDAAFTSLQALIYTNVISFAVKWSIGRTRPEDGKGPHDFAPFTDLDDSFPSGHTATAFAILSPWAFYYPHVLTYGLLVIGGGAALARLQQQKHWLTDVLAGGTLGVTIAYWLSRKHQGRLPNTSVAQKQQQKHWLTDVLAGATLGITMAYWPSLKRQGRLSNMSVVPTVGPGSVGLTMQMTF